MAFSRRAGGGSVNSEDRHLFGPPLVFDVPVTLDSEMVLQTLLVLSKYDDDELDFPLLRLSVLFGVEPVDGL